MKNILSALKQGQVVALTDDNSVTGRTVLLAAAENISEKQVAFLVNEARGIICAALSETRARELGLHAMAGRKNSGVNFTVSVEARQGVTTGISAADRAVTLQILTKTKEPRLDLVMPGHIFPVRARNGGVLVKSDFAEAAVDLLLLAEINPVAAFCDCLNENGDFLSPEELSAFLSKHNLLAANISDLVRYRMANETMVDKIAEAALPTTFAGEFRAFCFRSRIDQAEHLALVKGEINLKDQDGEQLPVPVRVQSGDQLGDLLGLSTDPGLQRVRGALAKIAELHRGVFVYIRHPKKGALAERARILSGSEVAERNSLSQLRELGVGAQILSSLGVKRINLLSNTSREIPGIGAFQLEIVEQTRFEPQLQVD